MKKKTGQKQTKEHLSTGVLLIYRKSYQQYNLTPYTLSCRICNMIKKLNPKKYKGARRIRPETKVEPIVKEGGNRHQRRASVVIEKTRPQIERRMRIEQAEKNNKEIGRKIKRENIEKKKKARAKKR